MNFSSSLWRALVVITLSMQSASSATPEQFLKIATIAPEGSSWVKTLRAIDEEVRKETSGALGLKIYAGGVQGNEEVVLRKIRVGQLHGGGFGGMGTTLIFKDVLALELPFLFEEYGEIDYVLEQMDEFYTQGYLDKGFAFLGWCEIGYVYLMSLQPVRSAEDIRGMKAWRLDREPVTEVLFRKAGVVSVPLTIPDVLLGLQTNLIEVAYAPPSAAIVLQWFTRVKYVTELPINYTVGAFLIDRRAFDRVAPEHQKILKAVSRRHMRKLSVETRDQNLEAVTVMKAHGLEFVAPLESGIKDFESLVDETIVELAGKAFSRQSLTLVNQYLGEFRQRKSSE
jgi:TRAP-type C4-dicarboxylate transport system substrate-binding protein